MLAPEYVRVKQLRTYVGAEMTKSTNQEAPFFRWPINDADQFSLATVVNAFLCLPYP